MQHLREIDGDNKQVQQPIKETQPTREEVEQAKNNQAVRVVETQDGPKILKHLRG